MKVVELGARAFWLVVAAGLVSGAISWWAFRRLSDRQALRKTTNRIVAHLFELLLFRNEPRLVMRSQRDLLAANARLLKQLSRPTLILLVPFTMLFLTMDAVFSRAPLQPGRAAIVTLQCKRLPGDGPSHVILAAPDGMAVETPPVHILTASQIAWRVRPMRAAEDELRLTYAGRVITKRISSVHGLRWLPEGWSDPLSVQYPPAAIRGWNWLVWYMTACVGGGILAHVFSHRLTYL